MMLPGSIEVRFGKFSDVLGPAIAHGDFTFVPAEVELSGYENGPLLADAAVNADPATRALIHPGEDAPWACGRIQRLFQQPLVREEDRGEKCCMWYPFLAIVKEDDSAVGIPFVCTDYYGESIVLFSDDPMPETETMQAIASAFWSLLLQDADELVDYRDRMEHFGAGVTIEFGVEDGEPFMRELDD
jgi:hypothetical protein